MVEPLYWAPALVPDDDGSNQCTRMHAYWHAQRAHAYATRRLLNCPAGVDTLAGCFASCLAFASCRHLSYAASTGTCDRCSSCTTAQLHESESHGYDSYRREEPHLPSLLPFSLALNGQQYVLSDSDRTFELGYLMYAATAFSVSVSGGPRAGGTLVTVAGRGFARAAARAASAPARFGPLWWQRNATLAPRCRFHATTSGATTSGATTSGATTPQTMPPLHTTPLQLRDDELVCPTPHFAVGGEPGGLLTVSLTVALNAARFDGGAAYASGAPGPAPHGEPFDIAHFELTVLLTLTLTRTLTLALTRNPNPNLNPNPRPTPHSGRAPASP